MPSLLLRSARVALCLALVACSDSPTTPAEDANTDIPRDPSTPVPSVAPRVGAFVPSGLSIETPTTSNPRRVKLTVGGLTGGVTYSTSNLTVVEDGVVKGIKLTAGSTAALRADVVFVIDNTSSMSPGIASVRSSVLAFITALRSSGQDVRAGVVAYNDDFASDGNTTFLVPASDSASRAAVYGYRPLSADLASTGAVYTFVAGLPATGGGDSPELAFSAIDFARRSFAWRAGAQRIYIVITDITSWGRGRVSTSKGINSAYPWTDVTLGEQLRDEGSVVHTVAPDLRTGLSLGEFNVRPLSTLTGGTWTQYTSGIFDLTTLPILGVTTSSVLVEFVKGSTSVLSRTLRVVVERSPTERGERSVTATY